jgi:hypothetical protein
MVEEAAALVVYQAADSPTVTVLRRFPDDAVLRRRAYFHALDRTRDRPTRPLVTDRTA